MRRILLCLDGSQYGRSCCGYAAWLAGRTGAQVDALYVSELWQFETPLIADFGGSLGAQPYLALTSQLQEIEKQKASALKAASEDIFEKAGVVEKLRFHHRTGVLVDCLDEFEKGDNAADFIVIGKRGENANFAKGHLGPNMERVARAGSLPVFVASREFSAPTKALLAYDGSPSAQKALAWMTVTKALDGVEKHVVSVARSGEEKLASERIAEAEKSLGAGKAVYQVLGGHPGEAVAEYAGSNGINLLVMGAYGHSAIRRLIIGSTTTELVRACKIPVILFR
jgi:nucleotide-binding universal stress UspA family protein